MSGRTLTTRRKEILQYISQATREHGYPPTVREIGKAVGLKSSSSVHFHLKALEEMELLWREGSLTRALRLAEDQKPPQRETEVRWLPLVGQVAAGSPIIAEENCEAMVPLPTHMVPNGDVFMLRIEGDSMIEKGIFDGDQVIVARTDTAHDGDIVVALLEDEATVKTFYHHGDTVELRPANSAMESTFVDEVRILGKVSGLVRQFA